MVCPHSETSTQKIWSELADEANHGQELFPGGAIRSLFLGESVTAVPDNSLLAILNLDEFGTDRKVRGVCVQDKMIGRCRDT